MNKCNNLFCYCFVGSYTNFRQSEKNKQNLLHRLIVIHLKKKKTHFIIATNTQGNSFRLFEDLLISLTPNQNYLLAN